MSNTVNNGIPFVPENTIDPAAGLNESLLTVDALLQLAVVSVGDNAPPSSPANGARYIVGTAPTGAWAGRANQVAQWLDGGWRFYAARYALNAADGLVYVRQGATWSVAAAEWTAETVSQPEAEAGTATIRRAWTAERVRQAILGWWNGATSVFGRGFVAAADAAAGRAALELGSASTAIVAQMPFINLMPDSGRFAGKMNPLALSAPAAFTASPFFGAVNGSSQSNGGKFIHNNTTYGGTAGELSEPVVSLLAAMGRSTLGDGGNSLRYGVEFYVSRITAGSGVASPSVGVDGVTRYLLTLNGARALAGASCYFTAALWVRILSGSAHCSAAHFINGVPAAAGAVLSSGWVHFRVIKRALTGYDTAMPLIYAAPGSEVEIACPAFFSGLVDVGLHTAPLPTINELSA